MTVPLRPEPYVDPRLERHRALLDSLGVAVEHPPDSVVRRALIGGKSGWYDDPSRTVTVSPASGNPRRTLLHEYGHLLAFNDPDRYYEFSDSQRKRGVEGMEDFADTFAEAFDALSRRDLKAAQRGRRAPLARLLAGREPFASDTLLAALRRARLPDQER